MTVGTVRAQHPSIFPTQLLVDSTPVAHCGFGKSVAAEDDALAVGAHLDIDGLGNDNGTVVMFRASPSGVLVEQQVLTSSYSQSPYQGLFGFSVAMGYGRLVIAAPSEPRPDGRFGVLHSYEYDAIVGWFEAQVVLDPPLAHPAALDYGETRGFQLCLRGDHLFVSCRTAGYSGRVLYYHHDGNAWQFVTAILPITLQPGVHMNFGWSLDANLEAGLLVVGANINPGNGLPGIPRRSGRAYVYNLVGSGQQAYQIQPDAELHPPAPREGGLFGEGCAVLGPGHIAVSTGSLQWANHEFYYEYDRGAAGWTLTRRAGYASSTARSTFLLIFDGVLYLGLPSHETAAQSGSAVMAVCLGDDFYNPAGILWQSNVGGVFPMRAPAIGTSFLAVGSPDHYHTTSGAGGVAIYPRPSPPQCLRATIAQTVCSASVTGCPGGGAAPSDPLAGCVNSTGSGGRLHYQGMAQFSFNTGRMLATGLPPSEFAVLLRGYLPAGAAAWNPAGHQNLGSGVSCLVDPLNAVYPIRHVAPSGTASWFDIIDVFPNPNTWGALQSWNQVPFQVWYRDRDATGAATSNTTNAVVLPLRLF